MLARFSLAALGALMVSGVAWAQTRDLGSGSAPLDWQSAGTAAAAPGSAAPAAAGNAAPAASAPGNVAAAVPGRTPVARVTKGSGTLPNEAGQVWREYDISPYTLRVTTTNRPEQAIIDWILRETGYEPWHGEPLGVLSATRRSLRVYHTPQMQATVSGIVDRFVSTKAETRAFGFQVITVEHPNWRAKVRKVLHPVQVQTPGVQAWLLEREDAALVLAELRRRTDYREHNSPHILVPNGQSQVITAMRARTYVRDVALRGEGRSGYEPEVVQIDEGFSLEFSPLLSVDGRMIDAAIKCNIDQVEKMVPVMLDVPTAAAPRQRTKIEVPQMAHFRFHERFRWPESQVLVIGMGMVPVPVPVEGKSLVPGIPLRFPSGPPRGEMLVVIESRGKLAGAPASVQAASRQGVPPGAGRR